MGLAPHTGVYAGYAMHTRNTCDFVNSVILYKKKRMMSKIDIRRDFGEFLEIIFF